MADRLSDAFRDLRQALRALAHTRSFTVTAIGTLGLAIGASAAIFTVVDTVLLDPLPYADADRLVVIEGSAPGTDLDGRGALGRVLPRVQAAGGSAREYRDLQPVHEHAANRRTRRAGVDVEPDAVALRDARLGAAAWPAADARGRRPGRRVERCAVEGVVRRRSERARPQLLDCRRAANRRRRHGPGLRFPDRGRAALVPEHARRGRDRDHSGPVRTADRGARSQRRGTRGADRAARFDREPAPRKIRRLAFVRRNHRAVRSARGVARGGHARRARKAALDLARRHGDAARDRVRQRRQPISGSHRAATPRPRGPSCDGRRPRPPDPAAARRNLRGGDCRRRRRRRRRRSSRPADRRVRAVLGAAPEQHGAFADDGGLHVRREHRRRLGVRDPPRAAAGRRQPELAARQALAAPLPAGVGLATASSWRRRRSRCCCWSAPACCCAASRSCATSTPAT